MPLDGRLVLRRPYIKGLCGEGPEKSAIAHPSSHCYHTPTETVYSEGFITRVACVFVCVQYVCVCGATEREIKKH